MMQDGGLTKKTPRRREIRECEDLPSEPAGKVAGFWVLVVRAEASYFYDAIFGGDEQTLRSMKMLDDDEDYSNSE